MSHFYAQIPVSARKTNLTARGFKSSGIVTHGASWNGCIETRLWHNEADGKDWFTVSMQPWHGSGDSQLICEGIVGDRFSLMGACIDEDRIKSSEAAFLERERVREINKAA